MRKFIIPFLSLFFISDLFCQEKNRLPTGMVIDTVFCQTDAKHNYALYLPSNYTLEKTWPIIYAFDPGARGKVPVDRLRTGAEKFGYIVVGSNNSRNGPFEPIFENVNAISDDTQERFSIDPQHTYPFRWRSPMAA